MPEDVSISPEWQEKRPLMPARKHAQSHQSYPAQEERPEQSSDKVLRLLQVLADSQEPQTVKVLAQRTGFPLSSVYRHLAVLRDWELAQEDFSGKGYLLGARALTLSSAFYQQFSLSSLALPALRRLMERTGETALLVIPAVGRVVCIESVECAQPLRYTFQRGVAVSSPLRGASALAMLPYYSEHDLKTALNADPELDPDAIFARREQIRQAGYVISEGEVDQGVVGVGAAILGDQHRLIGSVSVVAPAARTTALQRGKYALAVQEAAQDISALVRGTRGAYDF